jgi:hypothetical protein
MFPKVIWQGIISVRGRDHAVRCVQIEEDRCTVEWSESRDAMGECAWVEFDNWYNEMVGDIIRQVCNTPIPEPRIVYAPAPDLFARKISLIKLVREASSMGGRHPMLGLHEAKELVEEWMAR